MEKSQAEITTGQVPGYPHLDETCGYCQHFIYKAGNPEIGESYCRLYQKWFPNQFDNNNKPAPSRTCNRWLRKTLFNLNEEEYEDTIIKGKGISRA